MYSTAQTVRKLVEKKNAVYLYHFAYSGHYKRNVVTIPGYNGNALSLPRNSASLFSKYLDINKLNKAR